MAQVEQTMEEVIESLTGFEEMAISGQFGRTVGDMADRDPLFAARAMVFILKKRDGLADTDAKTACMEMRLKDVMEYFVDPSKESDESGKGEQVSELPPTTSPTSVS